LNFPLKETQASVFIINSIFATLPPFEGKIARGSTFYHPRNEEEKIRRFLFAEKMKV